MWAKDDYQENMLGYLDEVRTEIEGLSHSRVLGHDLDELYTDLNTVSDRLWQLIAASDVDWEKFRHPLEISFDELLRTYYRIPHSGMMIPSVNVIITDNYDWKSHTWKPVKMLQ